MELWQRISDKIEDIVVRYVRRNPGCTRKAIVWAISSAMPVCAKGRVDVTIAKARDKALKHLLDKHCTNAGSAHRHAYHLRALYHACVHDTNGDGDCHRCYKRGGCPAAAAREAIAYMDREIHAAVAAGVQDQALQNLRFQRRALWERLVQHQTTGQVSLVLEKSSILEKTSQKAGG